MSDSADLQLYCFHLKFAFFRGYPFPNSLKSTKIETNKALLCNQAYHALSGEIGKNFPLNFKCSHYCTVWSVLQRPGGGGGNAIYVPYGDVPPIRVYFLAFESETGCLFSSLTLKQGAKFVRSIRARVPIHSTVWHPHVRFNLFVFCSGN